MYRYFQYFQVSEGFSPPPLHAHRESATHNHNQIAHSAFILSVQAALEEAGRRGVVHGRAVR